MVDRSLRRNDERCGLGPATPADAIGQAVAESGVFPDGTSVVSVTVDGASVVIDLSAEAAVGLSDTQSDDMVEAIIDALASWGNHRHRGDRRRHAFVAIPAACNRG